MQLAFVSAVIVAAAASVLASVETPPPCLPEQPLAQITVAVTAMKALLMSVSWLWFRKHTDSNTQANKGGVNPRERRVACCANDAQVSGTCAAPGRRRCHGTIVEVEDDG